MHNQGVCDGSAQRPGEWADSIEFYIPTFNLPRASAPAYPETKGYDACNHTDMDGERSYSSYSKLYLYITAYDVPLSKTIC